MRPSPVDSPQASESCDSIPLLYIPSPNDNSVTDPTEDHEVIKREEVVPTTLSKLDSDSVLGFMNSMVEQKCVPMLPAASSGTYPTAFFRYN